MFEPLESRKLFSTVTVAPVTVTEPTTGSTPATFTATLKSASSNDVTVTYATVDRSAKAGSDYTATSGSVTIPAGETSAAFSVPVLADDVWEATESFVVKLKVSAGNKINGSAVGTILNSTPLPTVTVEDTAVEEPDAKKRSNASVTVDLSNPSTRPVTVYVRTVDGTATAGTDYVAATKRVVIRAGQTSATATFKVIGNAANTNGASFDVAIVRVVNGTIDAANSTGTITLIGTDETFSETVSVAPTSVTAPQTGTAMMAFTVTLSAAQSVPVTVDYATSDGTATAGVDYAGASGALTFPAGATAETIPITILADAALTADETLNLTLFSPVNAVLGTSTAIGTIVANGSTTAAPAPTPTSAPTASLSAASATASASATTTLSFTVTLSSAATSAVTVQYATSNGTAVAGTDYVAASGTLTIAANATTGTIAVTVDAQSATTATTKAMTLTLSSPTNATLGTATATGTISIPATSTGTTDLSDNLSATTAGNETATGASRLAASFTTGTSAVTLRSVTLPISVSANGSVTVAIYTDDSLEPGTLVGTLTSPSSYSTAVADATFTGSVSLSASTTYWVVVTATSGTVNWAWTEETTGTGSGFTGDWASSSDGGDTWAFNNTFPVQMQVLAS